MNTVLLSFALASSVGLGASQGSEALGGTLLAAELRIVRYDEHSVVILTYLIDRSEGPLVFTAMRLRGQLVLVEGAYGPDLVLDLEQQLELRRLTAPPGQPGEGEFRIRYKVEGELSRIPLFVPNAPTSERGTVDLVVIGATADIDVDAAFPRLTGGADGLLTATLSNVPSVASLPSGSDRVNVVRLSQLTVVLLLVGGSAYWAFRTGRLRRRSPQAE